MPPEQDGFNSTSEIVITVIGFGVMVALLVASWMLTDWKSGLVMFSIELLCFSVGGRAARHVYTAKPNGHGRR